MYLRQQGKLANSEGSLSTPLAKTKQLRLPLSFIGNRVDGYPILLYFSPYMGFQHGTTTKPVFRKAIYRYFTTGAGTSAPFCPYFFESGSIVDLFSQSSKEVVC